MNCITVIYNGNGLKWSLLITFEGVKVDAWRNDIIVFHALRSDLGVPDLIGDRQAAVETRLPGDDETVVGCVDGLQVVWTVWLALKHIANWRLR